MAKFILPALAVTIGLLQVAVPNLSRTYTLVGGRRNNAHYLSPSYASLLDPLCMLQHTDKFHGCESMQLVELSPTRTVIFTSCLTSYANRPRVLSQSREADAAEGKSRSGDKIFRWDLDTDEGFHGMDVNYGLEGGRMSLYVVNHRFNGTVVEKFMHDPATDVLEHVASIPTAEGDLKHPNDIYAIKHLDDINAFYITDENRYSTGLMRFIGDYTRRPWGSAHYYSAETGWKLVMTGLGGGNGITGDNKVGGRVYISPHLSGEIVVTDQDASQPGVLKELQRIPLNFMGDNPTLSSSGEDIIIAGYTDPRKMYGHVADRSAPAPGSIVGRISTKQLGSAFFGEKGGYTSTPVVDEMFVDIQGRWINASSTAILREKKIQPLDEEAEIEEDDEVARGASELGDLYITGLTTSGILKCKGIPSS
ncbi:uncharacterized protein LAJ45_07698 [Morchella importuna]|uniref:uncharacterized protein n=1 Tax=Morchella importuna TaxID=1174673 RepID=UPI001E8E6B42|nr:uncharacterized protein LAJ45_07698 [Morchella importuna]KAH8148246.1 hypothetical protein LAJ45_07698 [Morchella importuna]